MSHLGEEEYTQNFNYFSYFPIILSGPGLFGYIWQSHSLK